MKGVDIYFHNGVVNWHALKDAGIDFAIFRTGYGKNGFDETFQRNVNGARAAGLKCGAYHYSYALTPADAILAAQFGKHSLRLKSFIGSIRRLQVDYKNFTKLVVTRCFG
ncbi:MAG: hypothetical protein IJK81_02885 [Selenomonadaceae bacterium]|nr:hypothetical protein [Selenomonadaceae bacterium]